MAVYVNNITINTGEYFSRDFYLDNVDGTPLNLVGYAASSYIRKHPESLNPTAKFNVGFIDRANGRIRVSLGSTVTAAIKPGRYVYDVLFVDNTSKKSIVIEGNVLATEDISINTAITSYANSVVGIITEKSSNVSPSIDYDEVGEYGVVHIGVNFNECSQFSALPGNIPSNKGYLLDNLQQDPLKLQALTSYMLRGGVIWFNAEWWGGSPIGDGCSNKDNINSILTLLGTEIRAVSDVGFVGTATRSTNSIIVNSGFPATQSNNASVIFSGGTPVYFGGTDAITTYEKIGYGILYVSGDSNTFSGPSYPTTYYNALRNLVLYG
jgi:hypothetical protein